MFTEDRDDSVEPELGLGQGPCNAVKPSWVCLSHAHWLLAIKERVKRPPIGIALVWHCNRRSFDSLFHLDMHVYWTRPHPPSSVSNIRDPSFTYINKFWADVHRTV